MSFWDLYGDAGARANALDTVREPVSGFARFVDERRSP